MRPEVKRWFKIVFCTLMVVFSVSIGFSDWVYPDNSGDKTTGSGQPSKNEAKPCAYIDGDENTLYTIEDALKKAASLTDQGKNAVNVYVKPGSNVTIGSCSITKNVTLILPYDGQTYKQDDFINYQRDESGNIKEDSNGNKLIYTDFADNNAELYRKSQITISSGSVLSIEEGGTLNIGGQNGGSSPQGATTGMYCEVVVDDNAVIDIFGSLVCYGFIKEKSLNLGNIIVESTGVLSEPLCVYDWGTATSVYRKQRDGVFPFNQFDFPNIRPIITFITGSQLIGLVHSWGSSAGHFSTTATVITSGNSSFLQMKEKGGSLQWHYTDCDLTKTNQQNKTHKTIINLLSDIDLGKLIVSLDLSSFPLIGAAIGKITIDSSNYYLPVYYGYEIYVKNCELNILYKTKFMPGSLFVVDNGATVSFKDNVVFYQSNKGQDGSTIPSYSIASPALFKNSGVLNIEKGFEGKIDVGDTAVDNGTTKVSLFNGYSSVNDCMEGSYIGSSALVLTTEIKKYGPFSFGGARGLIAVSKVSKDPIEVNFAKSCTYLGYVSYWYYDTISIDSCFSIKEDPAVSVKETKKWGITTGGSFSVGLKLIASSFDTRVINIDSAKCVWNVPAEQGKLKNIKGTISNNGYTCSITGDIGDSGDFTLPVSVKVTLENGLSSELSYNISINASCLIYDSMLLMADGTYKKAGEVIPGDMVMSFNHETGNIEPTAVIVNDDVNNEAAKYNVINLYFSDGTKTSIVSEHGFFDLDLNKYVYIREDNYSQYIGHSFYGINGDGDLSSKKVKLLSANIEEKFTKVCSPVTANNLNIISDNMLSMAGGIEGLFNFFDYDPATLKYDETKKQADIEKYGLMTYEDYKDLLPYELYEVLPCQYMSVSIGKGLITWDTIKEYINHWSDQLLS